MNDVVPARGSLRSRSAAAVSAVTVRQITGLVPPEPAWGMWLGRRIIAGLMGTFGPPLAGTRIERVDAVTSDGRRVVGEWVHGPRSQPRSTTGTGIGNGGVIYYLHGSGYTMCSPKTHRRLTSWLSSLTGLPVFCVEYRLAPRHRFPAAADDVRAGWDWLLQTCGLPPGQIVIAGDSAGGHLAVDLLLQPEVAAKQPAAAVLLSPLFDLTFALCAASEQIRRDPTMGAASAARVVSLYHAGIDPAHHRLKLDVAGGPVLPPTLIQAGGAEMLQGDARQLAAEIRAAGGSCELQVWPHQLHVFQALPKMAPEAARAMAYVAEFIADSLCANASMADEAG